MSDLPPKFSPPAFCVIATAAGYNKILGLKLTFLVDLVAK